MPSPRKERLTVAQAVEHYLADRAAEGQNTADAKQRLTAHVLPRFGAKPVCALTAPELKAWRDELAAAPPRARASRGAPGPKWRSVDLGDPEVRRQRRSTVNRITNTFKAVLNHAAELYPEQCPNRAAWKRGLKAFRRVERPRTRWLTHAECTRLVAACETAFALLVRAALYTGCRYGELRRARAGDYQPTLPALRIPVSKTDKWRDVFLNDEAAAFFSALVAARADDDFLFEREPGVPWGESLQARRIATACRRARIAPPLSFNGLRHTYSSLAVQAGMPLIALARNLGHVDTRMVEKHYGHLSDHYMREQVRRFALTLEGGASEPE
jgi:integrase